MMKNNDKRKGNNTKKLIPAAGMLALSASMLATSTYAWFTMSREVEVKNIQMTATVPEDIQISLGHLTNFAGASAGDALVSNASSYTGLSGNQGVLKKATSGATDTADDGNVLAPLNGNDAVSALDWASSADISEYYMLGKIIPASSTTGADIYFTPDAAGVGKTLKAGAKYYQAANINGDKKEKAETGRTTGEEGSLKTTLHAISDKLGTPDTWSGYQTGTEWNITNDDGYYVDIPIWFRSSAQDELNLSVDAYVTTKQAKDEDDLYLAARAVILYNSTAEASGDNKGGYADAPSGTSNLLRIRQDNMTGNSIVNYMYSTNSTGDAVASVASNVATYGDVTEYEGAQFLKVAAGANNGYGPMTKAIVRVWLEGEDPNCWNSNAGQDFSISLRFTKDNLSATPGATYPATAIDRTNKKAASDVGSLQPGARVKMTSTTTVDGTDKVDTLEFEFNGTKWYLVTDGSFHKYEGHKYSYGSNNDIQNSDDIAAELLTQVKTAAAAEASLTTPITITVDPT